MDIDYDIKEVKPNIFAISIKDDYDRAMVFCRAQEYYESQGERFKGKNFSIWDYMKWYSSINGSFSYPQDWGGFNIPLPIIIECYKNIEPETPYDRIMANIIMNVETRMFRKKLKINNGAYVIGVGKTSGETFQHEVCHGLYYTNKKYKQRVDKITSAMGREHRLQFTYNLFEMGYAEDVINDEIQAYLCTNWDNSSFSKKVPKEDAFKYHQKYKKVLESF